MKSLPLPILCSSLVLLLSASATTAQTHLAQLDAATTERLRQQSEALKRDQPDKRVDDTTRRRLEYQAQNPTNPAGTARTPLQNKDLQAAQRDPMTAVTAGENPIAQELAGVTTVVFISDSMPAHTLAPIMQAGVGRPEVLYLLRGWKGDGQQLAPLVKSIRQKAGLSDTAQINLYVLPKAFRQYQIERVPAYVIKSKSNGWRGLMGNVSLKVAADEIEAGRWGHTMGNTWAVAEPDKALEYEQKLRSITPEMVAKQRKSMAESAEKTLTKGSPLPMVKTAASRLFDPAVPLEKDIVIDGQVRAKKGQMMNALAIDPTGQRYYAAIDATDPWQLTLAKKWSAQYPGLMLFFTNRDGRINEIGVPAYPAAKNVLARIGITEVPSRASQEGLKLRSQTFTKQ